MTSVQLLSKKRIFVVEDNLENRIITRMILSKHGASVGFEMFGHSSVQKLREFGATDLIILDLMLAFNSGYEIFDQIRQLPEYLHVPIVAVSAADPSGAIPACITRGFSGFIAKPIDSELFPAQLASILQGKAVWSEGNQHLPTFT